MISNDYVLMVSDTLKDCVRLQTEEEKISLLLMTLKLLGVSKNSAIFKDGVEYLWSLKQLDDGWSTPLVTAQSIFVLKDSNYEIIPSLKVLLKWMNNGLWGRNTRDRPRLAVTSEITSILAACNYFEHIDKSIEGAEKLWSFDIEHVPYVFKGISFLEIVKHKREYTNLVKRTLDLFVKSQQEDGSFPFVLGTRIGKCDIINLVKIYITMQSYDSEELNDLKLKLYLYLTEKIKDINHFIDYKELCFKAIFSLY